MFPLYGTRLRFAVGALAKQLETYEWNALVSLYNNTCKPGPDRLTALPDTLIIHVFQFLELAVRVHPICKRLAALASTDSMWRDVEVEFLPGSLPPNRQQTHHLRIAFPYSCRRGRPEMWVDSARRAFEGAATTKRVESNVQYKGPIVRAVAIKDENGPSVLEKMDPTTRWWTDVRRLRAHNPSVPGLSVALRRLPNLTLVCFGPTPTSDYYRVDVGHPTCRDLRLCGYRWHSETDTVFSVEWKEWPGLRRVSVELATIDEKAPIPPHISRKTFFPVSLFRTYLDATNSGVTSNPFETRAYGTRPRGVPPDIVDAPGPGLALESIFTEFPFHRNLVPFLVSFHSLQEVSLAAQDSESPTIFVSLLRGLPSLRTLILLIEAITPGHEPCVRALPYHRHIGFIHCRALELRLENVCDVLSAFPSLSRLDVWLPRSDRKVLEEAIERLGTRALQLPILFSDSD